jgi:transposase
MLTPAMDREAQRVAKAQLVAQMQAGRSWHEAATSAGVQTSRASAYRLLRRVHLEGAVALDDHRHGHPTKVRQPVRDWLAAFCRAAPASTGRTVKAALFEQLGLQISIPVCAPTARSITRLRERATPLMLLGQKQILAP